MIKTSLIMKNKINRKCKKIYYERTRKTSYVLIYFLPGKTSKTGIWI